MRDDLGAISATLRANPPLLEALSHPGIPADKKKAIVGEVFHGMTAPIPRLFEMLIDASRAGLIEEIAVRYREQWNARNNVHAARVISAMPLDAEAQSTVQAAIARAVSGAVEIQISQDPTLVGGLKVEVDGHLFDGSVKARLKALRQHLL